jgi:hypothetical protein
MVGLIDPEYLPFSRDQLSEHFAPVVHSRSGQDPERHTRPYEESAQAYRRFLSEHPIRDGIPMSAARKPCQIEKDERFWVASGLMAAYYGSGRGQAFSDLLGGAFGTRCPPMADFEDWNECITDDVHLFFEVNLPAPRAYKEWLQKGPDERQLVPYVRHAARSAASDQIKRNLEGPTHVDAMLVDPNTEVAVLFEAKVLSDISHDIAFDPIRNQIARNVDVMLEKPADDAPAVLKTRRPERTVFVLLTPSLFRDLYPHSRLYGGLMKEYREDSKTLERDMPHRKDGTDWSGVARRMGWLTWEECRDIVPGACAWLRGTGDALE